MAPPLCIIMDLMCEWVKYFNINLYVPPTRISLKAAQETSAFCLLLFLHLCLHFWLCYISFFSHLVSSTLHGLNSGVTRSALFIIVYLERTCFICQALLSCPIDCKASVDWIVERGDGKRRERGRERKWEKPFSTVSSSMKCMKLLCLTCCIDIKNIDFRQNKTLEHILEISPSTDVLWSGDSRW